SHAWNCVIDVVPYDTEATIFMGHPDQPYIYTRGSAVLNAYNNKINKAQYKDLDNTLQTLLDGFVRSSYYQTTYLLNRDVIAHEFSKMAYGPAPTDADGFTLTDRTRIEQAFIKAIDGTDVLGYFRSLRNLTTYLKSDANRNILSYVFGATEATRLINKYISASPLPLALLERAKESGFYSNAATFLFGKFYGIEPTLLKSRWPNCEYALSGILGRNANIEDLDPETQSRIESLAGITSYYSDEPVNSLTSKLLDKMDSLTRAKTFITGRANAINQTVMRNLAVLPWQLGPFLSREYETSTSLSKEVRKQIVSIGLYYTNYENGKNIDYSKTPQAVEYLNEALASLQSIVQLLENTRARDESRRRSWDSILKSLGYDIDKSSRDSVIVTLIIFKAFVYYFSRYVTETAEGQRVANSAETRTPGLPPNTKVFRVHHYSDNTRSIIRNNITATTNEMWNTVVIEHPSPGTADSTISDKTQMFTEGRVSAGANWIYWPKQEVSGVIGLQFNPGLTLANKKVEVFTELNCQSSDVAAKLACHHLAKGIQKMYRGTLMMIGKNMKPYDRIIIADKYKSMAGPVEVESVVHHFNSEVGWITNVVPHAVCDANPGAAILQTAAMEATFEAVFNIIDFALDLATIATIVATAGAGTPLAIGEFGIKKGVRNVAKRLLSRSPARFIKDTLRAQIAAGGTVLKRVGGQFKNTLKKGQTLNSLREIYRQIGGPANSLLKSYMYAAGAEVVTHGLMKANVIPAYVEGTNS
ncbi:MAG: hypothetical protein KDH96_09330, partial [Candidatus Riesia sp.]|nr:hypothetical protein [Candidatus Riesia sp.]